MLVVVTSHAASGTDEVIGLPCSSRPPETVTRPSDLHPPGLRPHVLGRPAAPVALRDLHLAHSWASLLPDRRMRVHEPRHYRVGRRGQEGGPALAAQVVPLHGLGAAPRGRAPAGPATRRHRAGAPAPVRAHLLGHYALPLTPPTTRSAERRRGTCSRSPRNRRAATS